MSISVNQLLMKIESELQKAKQEGNVSKIRERVHSIKILCELILEENETGLNLRPAELITSQQISQPITTESPSSKKLVMEEGVNGDSLFDF